MQKTRKLLLILGASLLLTARAFAANYEFELRFPEQKRSAPFTGRVYLFFSKSTAKEPRSGPDWFHPEPVVALDVENWKPDEPLKLGSSNRGRLLSMPKPFGELDLTGYRVQAVARFNPFERRVGNGPGNAYSQPAPVSAPEAESEPRKLLLDQIVAATPFPESKWCKLLSVRSARLSEFHGRDVALEAAVGLPSSYYDQPRRRYPVIFTIPGFGGSHREAARQEPISEQNDRSVEFIRVTLNPGCPLGHHAFADSANNGPVGTAFVTELIPELDRQYRTVAAPTARFLTGHSSGGWSSLWLQVNYPDAFGGTWSTSPDSVDFRDFQRVDMYHPGENAWRDGKGNRRPLARSGGQVLFWFDDFDRMEEVLGPGGQLHSFEAVFSPRRADGKPVRAWSRRNGAVDTKVAESWKQYDIRLILESRWPELGPKLKGKLHVIMGDDDTFYLDGATRLLKESLAKLRSDAVVELVPGRDHFTLYTQDLLLRIRAEMVQSYLRQHPAP